MLSNDIFFDIIQNKMFFSIGQGDFGMFDAVVFFFRKIRNGMISPVIQEKIMKERAAGGGSGIKLQKFACPV
jgi:hypothetical protein